MGMDINLTDKIAVVTGASRGIGLAISQAFAASGAYVIGGARHNSPELQALEAAGLATFIATDLTTEDGPGALIAAAAERGGIDILVNNAGTAVAHPGGFATVTDDDWHAAVDLGLLAPVRTTRAALPHMLARGGGSIIMIGSVNAQLPDPVVIDYSAAKAALTNLTKGLSKEFGPKGIRVNTISPGPVSTDLWQGEDSVAAGFAAAAGATAAEIVSAVGAAAASGRFTTPQEVAELAVFLASGRSANITGSDIRIDGGYVTTV